MRVTCLSLMIVTAVSIDCGAGENGREEPSFLAGRRECPKVWDWPRDSSEQDPFAVPAGQLSVPREIENVPEFHDCQRFVVESDGRFAYGDYFAIFAARDLGKTDTLEMLNDSTLGEGEREAITIASGIEGGEAMAAAEIVADADYAPLGIERGFNCLYVFLLGHADWRAIMEPTGEVEQDCSKLVDPAGLQGGSLAVRVTGKGYGLGSDDFPKAARWHWDSVSTHHYIGVKCGAGWCEVGEQDFTSDKDLGDRIAHPSTGSTRIAKRQFYAKGWYDEQFLAIPDGDSVVPSGIRGVIMPDTLLGTYSNPGVFEDWVLAAEVALWVPGESPNPYLDKFYFSDTPQPSDRRNLIYLCNATNGSACAETVDIPRECEGDSLDVRRWRAKIIRAADGDSTYKCVNRCDYTGQGFEVPGTARWRWLKDDEGAWMRCLQGCCELRGS